MAAKTPERDKIIFLLKELVYGGHSEEVADMFYSKLDDIIKDPKWSSYIFWSDQYFTEDNEIDYEKFLKKILEYEQSEEYHRNQYIISLVQNLLNKNFQSNSEVVTMNEINSFIPNHDWIDYLLVNRECFSENGKFNEKEFLRAMGLIDFEDSSLTYYFEHD